MDGGSNGAKPHRIGFFLLPDFTMMAFSAGVEPFRLANHLSEQTFYTCTSYSIDGGPGRSSNGMSVNVDGAIDEMDGLETVFVCGGVNARAQVTKPLVQKLRRVASHGTGMGAICTGSEALAQAGLLDGYSCTIHWENIPSFMEEYPDLDVVPELFEIDRNRYTCAGGTAALDMSLKLIALHYDNAIASQVADMLIQEPINCAALADGVGLSTRQLERLFRKYLGTAPTKYYLVMRLSRARFLLRQTSLPILSVALACGFVSASHFSKCYREHFSRTPSEERRPEA